MFQPPGRQLLSGTDCPHCLNAGGPWETSAGNTLTWPDGAHGSCGGGSYESGAAAAASAALRCAAAASCCSLSPSAQLVCPKVSCMEARPGDAIAYFPFPPTSCLLL